jgi:hypothetical protein
LKNTPEEFVELSRRGSNKTFKKQQIEKASEEEKKVFFSLVDHSQNECVKEKQTFWFDPVVDPKKFVLKQPICVKEGVSFLLFAALPNNKPIELLPAHFEEIGSGFCVHTGFYESDGVENLKQFSISIYSLYSQLSEGIFAGPSSASLSRHKELRVSLFNMGNKVLMIEPADPIGEIVFNKCYVPDIAPASCLIERFQGETNQIFLTEKSLISSCFAFSHFSFNFKIFSRSSKEAF